MLLNILSFLLLFFPIVYQFKIGNNYLFENDLKKFGTTCLLSLVFQIIATFISFFLTIIAISNSGNKCATGAVGIFGISFLISIFLLLLMLIQFIRRN